MNEEESERNKRQILVICMRNRQKHGMRFPGRPLCVTIEPFQERGCSNIPVTICPGYTVFLSSFLFLRIYGHVKFVVTKVAVKCVSSTVSHLSTNIALQVRQIDQLATIFLFLKTEPSLTAT